MQRKVNRVGPNTLTVSLPAKWAKAHGLKKGDEISVTESENALMLEKEYVPEPQQTSIDVTDQKTMVHRILAAVYKAGYDEATVEYSSPEELNAIQYIVERSLAEFDIIDYKQNQVRIKSISKLEPAQFETVFKRLFFSMNDIASDLFNAVSNGDYKEPRNIVLRDKSIDKYADFCRRSLNKGIKTKFKSPASIYYIIEETEIIGDMYKRLCQEIADRRLGMSAELKNLLNEINSFFSDFTKLVFKFDLEKVRQMGENRERLNGKIKRLYSKITRRELKTLSLLLQIFDATFEMKSALLTAFV